MSSDPQQRRKDDPSAFWRACRYLRPYLGIVVISIVCAVYVSAAATAGLGSLLPIMSVLLKGETVQSWAERAIVQVRLGVKFGDEPARLLVVQVRHNQPAAGAGIRIGDLLSAEGASPAQTLHVLSDPSRAEQSVHLTGA